MSYCSLSLYSNITPVRCTYASKQAQFCFTEFYRVKQKQNKKKTTTTATTKIFVHTRIDYIKRSSMYQTKLFNRVEKWQILCFAVWNKALIPGTEGSVV